MIHPGGNGEGRREKEHLGPRLGKGAEQLGEAQVVADGQAHDDAFAVEHGDPVPGGYRLRFQIPGAVGQHDVEEVELAVAGDLIAGAVEDDAGVVVAVHAPLDDASAVDEDAPLPGLLSRPLGAGTGDLLGSGGVLLVAPQMVEHLRQQDQVDALAGELVDALLRRGQVGGFVLPGVHLGEPDLHGAIIPRSRADDSCTAVAFIAYCNNSCSSARPRGAALPYSASMYSSAMWRTSSAFWLQRSAMDSSRSRMDLSWWKVL